MRPKILLSVVVSFLAALPAFAQCVTTSMSCNRTVTGAIASNDCVALDDSYYDVYQFTGVVGQTVTIDMTSNSIDSYLVLFDPAGIMAVENDDREDIDTLDARITFRLTFSGTWTIYANTYDVEQGPYSLTMSCNSPNRGACNGQGNQLCLNSTGLAVDNYRYRVTATATDPNGRTESGVPFYQTDLFGYFALPAFTGSGENPELFVKVLGPLNGVPWVFYAGLTNLRYSITVQDTQTGIVYRTYTKPAPPLGSFQSFGDYDIAGNTSPSCANVTVVPAQTTPAGSCSNSATNICLLNRFSVSLFAKDNPTRTSNSGPGQALPINSVFGFFSVPGLSNDPTNIEAFVKMVDGSDFNGKFWVFLGGLTDFELVVTVTDTQTGARKTYTKPPGSTCGWNDTAAF